MVEFMLAKEYTNDMKVPRGLTDYKPPIGWLLSEKYDGYRARWIPDKQIFLSRNQKVFNAPEWFKCVMPNVDLDGELFAGRENFQDMGVVRKKIPIDEEWINIKYVVYDLPEDDNVFEDRVKNLKQVIEESKIEWDKLKEEYPEPFNNIDCPVVYTEQIKVKSLKHLETIYKEVLKNGGEGVMIKDPKSQYEDKRSNYMLKYKPCFDAEAIIIDYKEGAGKYEGMLGGFVCRPLISYGNYSVKDESYIFSISGMDDNIRDNYKDTHPLGTVITYEYSGKTDSGKPRFPRYIRIRDDIVIKDDDGTSDKRDMIISIFNSLGNFEKANGEVFKANAYFKVIPHLKNIQNDSGLTVENLKSIKGLGKSLLTKIQEIIETGSCPAYDRIKDYDDIRQVFMGIHGIGPKNAAELVKAGFKSIEDLRNCPNIEDHLNNVQMIGLEYYEDLQLRIPREEIVYHERYLKQVHKLCDIPKGTVHFTIAGSYRRGKVDSGDIDILFTSKNKKKYDEFIDKLRENNYLVEDLARGTKKYNGICRYGKNPCRRIDIMYTKPQEYPFAILYFTGSMEFNTKMRANLLEQGLSLNEYSLKDNETKKPVDHKFVKEEDIFEYLNMDYVHPCDR
uniref:ATP-dependent DNA ligase family profile domain-containing protein n=1 Tax=viral metagenome TaxID=1070528 RepID=A0A6C0C7V9_9ZZZZ